MLSIFPTFIVAMRNVFIFFFIIKILAREKTIGMLLVWILFSPALKKQSTLPFRSYPAIIIFFVGYSNMMLR